VFGLPNGRGFRRKLRTTLEWVPKVMSVGVELERPGVVGEAFWHFGGVVESWGRPWPAG